MKKKLVGLVLILIILVISTEKIYASTDINSFTIDVERVSITTLKIKVNGEFEENALYYAKFVNKVSEKPTVLPKNRYDTDSIAVSSSNIKMWKSINHGEIFKKDDWYLLNGYDYVYIMKCDKDSCTISDNPIKVEKGELPELSKRYQIMIRKDMNMMDIFPKFPYDGENGSHKINLKVGIINDRDLLYKIYKNEVGALDDLMDYAKSNAGKSYSCIDHECVDVELLDLNINEGAYYYLYTTYENEDGMYRDLSDISIAQVRYGWLVNDIEWDFDENSSNDNTNVVKNPKTMDNNILLIAGLSVVMLLGVTLSIKKLKKLNK